MILARSRQRGEELAGAVRQPMGAAGARLRNRPGRRRRDGGAVGDRPAVILLPVLGVALVETGERTAVVAAGAVPFALASGLWDQNVSTSNYVYRVLIVAGRRPRGGRGEPAQAPVRAGSESSCWPRSPGSGTPVARSRRPCGASPSCSCRRSRTCAGLTRRGGRVDAARRGEGGRRHGGARTPHARTSDGRARVGADPQRSRTRGRVVDPSRRARARCRAGGGRPGPGADRGAGDEVADLRADARLGRDAGRAHVGSRAVGAAVRVR